MGPNTDVRCDGFARCPHERRFGEVNQTLPAWRPEGQAVSVIGIRRVIAVVEVGLLFLELLGLSLDGQKRLAQNAGTGRSLCPSRHKARLLAILASGRLNAIFPPQCVNVEGELHRLGELDLGNIEVDGVSLRGRLLGHPGNAMAKSSPLHPSIHPLPK